ncbi:probable WRKY transcription factor 27 [Lycium ferocissimum]|uniref:probable WRKY transcription factor 27 n=1 Tax=Lycium ferocissimum TaxID=112874 RepID=UPI0028164B96|nr:probable WRKY transcription factor 27 [Lycium ferocissimum]
MLKTPLVKTRKRKNQAIEIIYELRQEELLDDTWAWRKYGQKPIKTSSFPRNYYRCSTSKGCRAKKHIEKSAEAENLFVVVYSGEHNHPPPTKGSCLSGRSNRDTKSKLPKGINIVPKALKFNSSSSNFSQQHSSDSPISSKTPTLEIENACTNKNEMMTAEKKSDEEEEVVLIPNKFWNEDILKSFEVLNRITCNKFDSST